MTFFFNGGREQQFDKEERCMVPSPKDVPTYDKKPEMNALGVAEKVNRNLFSFFVTKGNKIFKFYFSLFLNFILFYF